MEALEVRLDDPIVRDAWMFTLRLNDQRLIVEVQLINSFSCEFAITDDAVLGDGDTVLSTLTKKSDRAYLLHTPGNLIEAAHKPAPAAA